MAMEDENGPSRDICKLFSQCFGFPSRTDMPRFLPHTARPHLDSVLQILPISKTVTFPSPERLNIANVQRQDRGMYQCLVGNSRDNAQGGAQLTLGGTTRTRNPLNMYIYVNMMIIYPEYFGMEMFFSSVAFLEICLLNTFGLCFNKR